MVQQNTLEEKLLWFMRDTQQGQRPRPIIGTVSDRIWSIHAKGQNLQWTFYAHCNTDDTELTYAINWKDGRFSDDACTELIALLDCIR